MQTKDNYTVISKETPLISNLNIIENISLIKESHEFMSAKKADEISMRYLEKISLDSIALKRPIQCSDMELLQIMLLRAFMCKNPNIAIVNPHYLINNLKDIKVIIEMVELLNEKKLLILDILPHEINYKGCKCHTIK